MWVIKDQKKKRELKLPYKIAEVYAASKRGVHPCDQRG